MLSSPSHQSSFKFLKGGHFLQFTTIYFTVISKAVVSHGGSLGALELLAWRRNLTKILIFTELQLLLQNEDNGTHTIGPHRRGNKIRDVKALEIVKGSLNVGDYYHTFF